MGCTSSNTAFVKQSSSENTIPDNKENLEVNRSSTPCQKEQIISNKRNQLPPLTELEVRKPVMFDIPNNDRNLSLLLPHRLERLEPLKGASVLTAEMLSQKMQSVEEKRIKQIEKRKNRKKNKLIKNQKIQQLKREEEIKNEIDEKIRIVEENKKMKHNELLKKQKEQKEKMERVRDRAKENKLKDTNPLEFPMENDTEYNAKHDVDSWPDEINVQEDCANSEKENKINDFSSHKSDSGTGSRKMPVDGNDEIVPKEEAEQSQDDGFFD